MLCVQRSFPRPAAASRRRRRNKKKGGRGRGRRRRWWWWRRRRVERHFRRAPGGSRRGYKGRDEADGCTTIFHREAERRERECGKEERGCGEGCRRHGASHRWLAMPQDRAALGRRKDLDEVWLAFTLPAFFCGLLWGRGLKVLTVAIAQARDGGGAGLRKRGYAGHHCLPEAGVGRLQIAAKGPRGGEGQGAREGIPSRRVCEARKVVQEGGIIEAEEEAAPHDVSLVCVCVCWQRSASLRSTAVSQRAAVLQQACQCASLLWYSAAASLRFSALVIPGEFVACVEGRTRPLIPNYSTMHETVLEKSLLPPAY